MESEKEFAKYLHNNQEQFKNVFLIPGIEEVVNIENICNENLDKNARAFHRIYSEIGFWTYSEYIPKKKDSVDWDDMEFFKKESSRYLYYHEHIKEMLFVQNGFSKEDIPITEDKKYWGIFERKGKEFLFSDNVGEVVEQINANPFLREMAMLEHRRWSYFMLLHGWHYINGKKNVKNKQTPYLVDWKRLCNNNPEMCVYDLMSLFKIIIEKDESDSSER